MGFSAPMIRDCSVQKNPGRPMRKIFRQINFFPVCVITKNLHSSQVRSSKKPPREYVPAGQMPGQPKKLFSIDDGLKIVPGGHMRNIVSNRPLKSKHAFPRTNCQLQDF